jgi:hypothetical protein
VENTPNTDENIKPQYFNLPISFHPVKWNDFVGNCIYNQSKIRMAGTKSNLIYCWDKSPHLPANMQ